MKIKNRLLSSFGIMILLTLVISFFTYKGFTDLTGKMEKTYIYNIDPMDHVVDIISAYQKMRVDITKLFLAKTEKEKKGFLDTIKEHEKDLDESIESLDKKIEAKEIRVVYEDLKVNYEKYKTIRDEIINKIVANDSNTAYELLEGKGKEVAGEMDHSIHALSESKAKQAEESYKEDINSSKIIIIFLMSIAGIVVLFGIIMSIMIANGISRPLQFLVEKFKSGAEGNLTVRIGTYNESEIGILGRYFDQFMESITKVVRKIIDSNKNMMLGTSEIAKGNQELASRVDAQSASLEETASSIEEMSANIKNIAEVSRLTQKVGGDAQRFAVEGEEVVKSMVQAIQEVSQQAGKIKEIVKIIDSIAFQTNILALNAAVEAARAKEHGKGFAVVANEVRTLAQKSAENAKEISEVIENIVNRIEIGNQYSSESQSKFLEIKEKIEQVNHSINEVSSAMGEQANGVDQINSAVGHLDEITQNNASMVEELAASTEELESQAKEVIQEVSFFKVDQNSQYESSYSGEKTTVKKIEKTRQPVRNIPERKKTFEKKVDYKEKKDDSFKFKTKSNQQPAVEKNNSFKDDGFIEF